MLLRPYHYHYFYYYYYYYYCVQRMLLRAEQQPCEAIAPHLHAEARAHRGADGRTWHRAESTRR